MGIKTRLAAAGVTGVLALAGSIAYQFEGEVRKVYVDPVGVLTSCMGHVSKDLRLGQIFTDVECTEQFIKDLKWAESVVNRCTSTAPQGSKPALISFAFWSGSGNYCTSTLAKLSKTGDHVGACKQIYRWTRAGGKDCHDPKSNCPGIITRREIEARACLEGVPRD
jgi:lysozyme